MSINIKFFYIVDIDKIWYDLFYFVDQTGPMTPWSRIKNLACHNRPIRTGGRHVTFEDARSS